MQRAKVREVMTERVISVPESASFKDVIETFMVYDISGAPVVDAQGKIVGVVTEGDLLGKEAGVPPRRRRLAELLKDLLKGRPAAWTRKIEATTAGELMSTPAYTAAPDDELRYVARRMMRHGVKRLPVVEDGKVIGIVSRQDVLEVFDRPDETLKAGIERYLRRSLFVAPEHDVHVEVEEGKVRLEGTVRYESDARIAAELVRSFDGVIAVANHLEYRLPDPYITPAL